MEKILVGLNLEVVAGGGGLYGGKSYSSNTTDYGLRKTCAGGGGSGYIGGCIFGTANTENGSRAGDGYARITYIGN